MRISELLKGIRILKTKNYDEGLEIRGLSLDSRRIKSGYTFLSVKGAMLDGHKFIDNAIENGAVLIVCEQLPAALTESVSYVVVKHVPTAVALAAANFYGHPSRKLKLIGVTGTNGKTSTVFFLHQIFNALGKSCGMLTTIRNDTGKEVVTANLTTPDAITINEKLAEMVDSGCEMACMEVSSHAADQGRILGLNFCLGLFTNISRDHLDYHGDFKSYIAAKRKFFDGLPADAIAIYNQDDRNGRIMVQNTAARKVSMAFGQMADYMGKIIENTTHGLLLDFNGIQFYSHLVGEFNAYNLLSAFSVASEMGMDREALFIELSRLQAAEGRFEKIYDPQSDKIAIVDYAHTPDALEKVLKTISKTKEKTSSTITVVGCGGDRDKTKRPIMAAVAARESDRVILTSDNPRTEEPYAILKDMMGGLKEDDLVKTQVIEDRRLAIRTAIKLARNGDIILVAGKGHETYQEINGIRHPFDDREEVKSALAVR